MKNTLLLILPLFLSFLIFEQVRADIPGCNPPKDSQWYWDVPTLANNTKVILVANLIDSQKSEEGQTIRRPDFKFVSQGTPKVNSSGSVQKIVEPSESHKFTIVEVLKGELKVGDSISIVTFENSGRDKATFNVRCFQSLKFKKGKKYLLFVDSYNPNGYREITEDDQFYNEIKSLLKK